MDTIEGRCFDSELQGTIRAIQREQPLKEQPENKEAPSHHVYKDFEAQLYVEIKCLLDATEVFIADLIACSTCFEHHYAHHQELKSIIQWLLRVVFCAVVFQVACLVWS